MSGSKTLLKAINDAIRSQRYDDAVEKAQELLKKDPKSYQGLIFLAFGLDKLDKLSAAEKAYNEAARLKPQEPQAWRGLIKLYERQGAARLAEYQTAAVNLVQAFAQGGEEEAHRCREVADKYVEHARAHGDEMQYAAALEIRLPESPVYDVLEGLVPPPGQTYETIAHILEKCEKTRINQEIGDRRTRIGAKLSEVTLAVKREVYAQSKLEFLYRRLVDWTRDDDLRRAYEEKLFQYCYDRLLVLPAGEHKALERQMVLGLANDMVVIRHPYKLAWDVAIDWQDHKDIQGWDAELLRSYCAFFPDSDLYKAITAFMTSPFSPFPAASQDAGGEEEEKKKQRKGAPATPDTSTEESEDDDDEGGVPTCFVPLTEEDRLIMMLEGAGTESVFAYRLAGQYFLRAGEYETTVEYMRKALPFLEGERQRTGFPFANSKDACSLSLATALIYYQTPRHHQEAKALFDAVLERDVTSTSALIGVGLIYEEEEEYDQAIDFLGRALARDGTDLRVRSEAAWVKALAGDWKTAREELQQCLELLGKHEPPNKEPPNKELLADTQYRLGTCIWNLDTSPQARKQRKGPCAYAYWLAALNNHLSHAPAYTSLGIFYGDYARDKKRARRCFQKALELSAAEVVAAERLARSFADDGDWDRVELVAQRIVDSGKVKPPPGSKRKGISWPFAALGVAELNKQDFHKAIVSFQAALRIAPEDYHSWVGLGESYCSSGRYMAATKAILNAKKLEEDGKVDASQDSWFTDYMLANVKRELGEYDESIALYRAVLGARPDEEGVILALLQTMVDSAVTSVEKGLFGKAVELAVDTITFAATAKTSEGGGGIRGAFNFWKSVAEACSVFSMVQSRLGEFPADSVRSLLEGCSPEAFDILASVDRVTADAVLGKENGAKGGEKAADAHQDEVDLDLARCLQATILCYKQAIHVCVDDFHAQAVAYYNLGWAEFRAHSCGPAQQRRKPGRYARASMRAFKRAIELEARNADFWNALGVVTSQINAQIAQHAFVRSLHLNERSPVAWANLGTLALLAGDARLANEAFTRAQSTDPDYAHAWLGQGFVALLCGDAKEARGLFTHAMEISEASSLPARRHYSAALFDHVLTAPSNLDVASLIEPLFAVNQIQGLQPDDIAFAHLSALFRERTRESGRAVKTLEQICAKMEADYEERESPESLAQFTLAKTDLARAYLAAGLYDDAVECGEMALGLSSDEGELTSEQRKRARLSAHLTVGLAGYYLRQFDEAEKCFEAASGESDNDPDAACLLAQVLWAQGTEAARDRARGALFDVIEKHPAHVQSVLLLGVIALLDEDEASLEAVVEELQGLRTDAKVTASEQSRIGEVLRAIAAPREGLDQDQDQDRQEMMSQVQTDIMLYPHQPHGWLALAETAGEGGEHPALVGLRVAARAVPPRGALGADGLAKAYAGTGRVADAQTSAFLAPWARDGWTALEAAVEGL
ncbi:Superkiller protein 3 [Escovopsis weberi]|uniref:Superkiller protein 3 n=1 Tax=Escovopsis weberi TaxID=150374 RepID=A0A0M8N0B4_ESCWE|nr:Superkiller protein 3 [Escovopsis weberi]